MLNISCRSGKQESASLKAARAELVQQEWHTKAIKGESEETSSRIRIRRVFVPPRELNGVEIPGNVQQVLIVED